MVTQVKNNSDLAAQLRALADVYERHPDIPLPHDFNGGIGAVIYCHDKETFAATVKAFGNGSKTSDKETVAFIPDAITVVRVMSWHSKVCERVVVGTREIPEEVVPEQRIPERVIPAAVIPARIEEIVEWRCKPFLETSEAA